MCSNYPGIKIVPAILHIREEKMEICRHFAYVMHTIAKQVISRRRTRTTAKCTKMKIACKSRCFSFSSTQNSDVFVAAVVVNWDLVSLRNHDDDGNKNLTNLRI